MNSFFMEEVLHGGLLFFMEEVLFRQMNENLFTMATERLRCSRNNYEIQVQLASIDIS